MKELNDTIRRENFYLMTAVASIIGSTALAWWFILGSVVAVP